jgi:hypothetical protein
MPHYLMPGRLAAIGKSESHFVCAYSLDANGWLQTEQVKILEPATIPAPLSAWRGTWQAKGRGTITIAPEGQKLHAWFAASYQFPDRKVVDYMEGRSMPNGSVVTFNNPLDHYDCNIRLMLIGATIVVTANDACTTGFNMRYGSFYQRAPKAKPASGRC